MINLILFGPPGSGKGTQATKLIEHYGYVHVSTGDLFRYEMQHNTPLGQEAKSYMSAGKLVPDHVTIGMLANKIMSHPEAKGFIFDGFPRTIPQADALDHLLEKMQQKVNGLVALDVPDEELVKRILERGKTSGRSDDNDEEIIRLRLDVYKKETAAVFSHYEKIKKAVSIHGIGTVDSIFRLLCNAIDQFVAAAK